MRLLRAVVAFAYGLVLFYFIWFWLGGFTAARTVPLQYISFFASVGHVGKESGLAVRSVVLHLLPTVCLLAAGTLLPARLCSTDRKMVGVSVLVGVVAGVDPRLFAGEVADL